MHPRAHDSYGTWIPGGSITRAVDDPEWVNLIPRNLAKAAISIKRSRHHPDHRIHAGAIPEGATRRVDSMRDLITS